MKKLWIILVFFFVDLITGSYTRKGINRQNLIEVNIDKTKIGTHGLNGSTQLRRKITDGAKRTYSGNQLRQIYHDIQHDQRYKILPFGAIQAI